MKQEIVLTENYAGLQKGDKIILGHTTAFKLVNKWKVAEFTGRKIEKSKSEMPPRTKPEVPPQTKEAKAPKAKAKK